MKNIRAFRLRQVERDGAFVAIAGEIISRKRPGKWRAPAAAFVAGARSFELDDIGPQVAEQLATERAGQDARGVEHANSMQGAVRISLHMENVTESWKIRKMGHKRPKGRAKTMTD